MVSDQIIATLGLQPHPEGGWFRETWRSAVADDGRASGTAILYLLQDGEQSRWHRVDADEIWLFHAGAPLEIRIGPDDTGAVAHRLGVDIAGGERPQIVVPAGHWQTARPVAGWTLVSCTVSPGFDYGGFEMAPDGFEIPTRR